MRCDNCSKSHGGGQAAGRAGDGQAAGWAGQVSRSFPAPYTFFRVVAKKLRLCEENARFSPDKGVGEGQMSNIYDILGEKQAKTFAQAKIFSNNSEKTCLPHSTVSEIKVTLVLHSL